MELDSGVWVASEFRAENPQAEYAQMSKRKTVEKPEKRITLTITLSQESAKFMRQCISRNTPRMRDLFFETAIEALQSDLEDLNDEYEAARMHEAAMSFEEGDSEPTRH